MRHSLKILPTYFGYVASGIKTFELRKYDRQYNIGDEVCLMEWSPNQGFTGRHITVEITYVLRDCPTYGLASGFCIFSFKKLHEHLTEVQQ